MLPLPADASDADILAFVDQWAALLAREDYAAALAFTRHIPPWSGVDMTAEDLRDNITAYDSGDPGQRVTVEGVGTGRPPWPPARDVQRWPTDSRGYCGGVDYDLNIDGEASSLTATFFLKQTDEGLWVYLESIHVL